MLSDIIIVVIKLSFQKFIENIDVHSRAFLSCDHGEGRGGEINFSSLQTKNNLQLII
jgi:hypothetical protein